MRTLFRRILTLALVTFSGALMAACAHAQATADSIGYDIGRFVVLDHGQPIATERFQFDRIADSIQVSATIERRMRAPDGSTKAFQKQVSLVVDAFDYSLRHYTSNTRFDGHLSVKGILPGDTVMTIFSEKDDVGSADRITQPPGRVFVMDPLVFSLFDVVCRNVHGHILKSRPISLITLGQESATSEATVTVAGVDTIQWGGKRMIAERFTITDSSSTFLVWTSPKGEMLRLEHAASGLVVQRDEPAIAPPVRHAPRTRTHAHKRG